MAAVTLELPDALAQRVKPFSRWIPTILEISLLSFKTPAAQIAHEVIEFLASNPSAQMVHDYYVSEAAQQPMSELMACNREGNISQVELTELDELLALATVITTLKASLVNHEIV
jgi:hypothetical protein